MAEEQEHIVIATIDIQTIKSIEELEFEIRPALEYAGIAVRQIRSMVIQPISEDS